jgi:hypothetical protein
MTKKDQITLDLIKKDLLNDSSIYDGLLRIFMSSNEIKAANQLVKEGLLIKGKSALKNGTIMYYLTNRSRK